MEEKYLHPTEDKLKWWGPGEWVNEPDEVIFEHAGFKCKIERMSMEEPYTIKFHRYGGHLCGYVNIPSYHSYFEKKYSYIDIDIHGGLTYGDFHEDGLYWIGFDCAHSEDIVPSTQFLKKTDPVFIKLAQQEEERKKNFGYAFKETYKNVEYCIHECKSLAEQLKEKK